MPIASGGSDRAKLVAVREAGGGDFDYDLNAEIEVLQIS